MYIVSFFHVNIFQMDTQRMLKTGITNTIQEVCSCNFTSSELEESEVTCPADDNTTLTFTTTVVYSTESGDMTASTMIRMFQERATSTNTVISVGSQTATIVSVCTPSCIPEPQPSPTSTPELQLEGPSPTTSIPELPVEKPHTTIAQETRVKEFGPTVASEPQVERPSPTIAPGQREAREPLTPNAATLVGAFLGGLATGIIICIIAGVIL